MENDSPSKPSVAELAGRFKGHILPMPTSNDESPFRRRPPSSLKLQNKKDENEESDKTTVSPNPFKIKMKNSPIIEKLQANLALSPTALLPSPKSPEVKLQPAPVSPPTPRSPASPTARPSRQSSEEEDPVSFESPPEGAPLPSINKTRARLSFKRRPPTRQHRRSAGEEAGPGAASPGDPRENGDVFDGPAEEAEQGQQPSLKEAAEEEEEEQEEDTDCDKAADGEAGDAEEEEEEQEAVRARISEALQDEEPLCPDEPIEGDVETEQGQEEEHRGGK